MYTYKINFKDGKTLVGVNIHIEDDQIILVNYMRERKSYNKSEIANVIEQRFFMGEVKEKTLFENEINEEVEEVACILWIRTKNKKGEDGFKVKDLEHAIKKFNEYVQYWNNVQENRHEKYYIFSGKFENQNGNIMPWKNFKKLI
jgi:hypothetical protein